METSRLIRMVACAGALCLGAASFARADFIVGYWAVNNTLDRSAGSSGMLTTSLNGSLVDYQGFGTGTPINLQPGFAAGESRLFFGLLNLDQVGIVQMTGLDLTGLQAPQLSFAVQKNAVLELLDLWVAEYNDGSGWQTAGALVQPDPDYSLRSFDFSTIGSLDNNSNVGLRIRWVEGASLINVLEFDNLLVTATPEPASASLLGLGAVMLWRKKGWSRPR